MARRKHEEKTLIEFDAALVNAVLVSKGPTDESTIMVGLGLPPTEDGLHQLEAYMAQNAEIAGWRRNDADEWMMGEPFAPASQGQLPGFERQEDPEIEPLALAHWRTRQELKNVQDAERKAKDTLDGKMHQKGIESYVARGDDGRLFRAYVAKSEKLKVELLPDDES
jgi:hypothetical protein